MLKVLFALQVVGVWGSGRVVVDGQVEGEQVELVSEEAEVGEADVLEGTNAEEGNGVNGSKGGIWEKMKEMVKKAEAKMEVKTVEEVVEKGWAVQEVEEQDQRMVEIGVLGEMMIKRRYVMDAVLAQVFYFETEKLLAALDGEKGEEVAKFVHICRNSKTYFRNIVKTDFAIQVFENRRYLHEQQDGELLKADFNMVRGSLAGYQGFIVDALDFWTIARAYIFRKMPLEKEDVQWLIDNLKLLKTRLFDHFEKFYFPVSGLGANKFAQLILEINLALSSLGSDQTVEANTDATEKHKQIIDAILSFPMMDEEARVASAAWYHLLKPDLEHLVIKANEEALKPKEQRDKPAEIQRILKIFVAAKFLKSVGQTFVNVVAALRHGSVLLRVAANKTQIQDETDRIIDVYQQVLAFIAELNHSEGGELHHPDGFPTKQVDPSEGGLPKSHDSSDADADPAEGVTDLEEATRRQALLDEAAAKLRGLPVQPLFEQPENPGVPSDLSAQSGDQPPLSGQHGSRSSISGPDEGDDTGNGIFAGGGTISGGARTGGTITGGTGGDPSDIINGGSITGGSATGGSIIGGIHTGSTIPSGTGDQGVIGNGDSGINTAPRGNMSGGTLTGVAINGGTGGIIGGSPGDGSLGDVIINRVGGPTFEGGNIGGTLTGGTISGASKGGDILIGDEGIIGAGPAVVEGLPRRMVYRAWWGDLMMAYQNAKKEYGTQAVNDQLEILAGLLDKEQQELKRGLRILAIANLAGDSKDFPIEAAVKAIEDLKSKLGMLNKADIPQNAEGTRRDVQSLIDEADLILAKLTHAKTGPIPPVPRPRGILKKLKEAGPLIGMRESPETSTPWLTTEPVSNGGRRLQGEKASESGARLETLINQVNLPITKDTTAVLVLTVARVVSKENLQKAIPNTTDVKILLQAKNVVLLPLEAALVDAVADAANDEAKVANLNTLKALNAGVLADIDVLTNVKSSPSTMFNVPRNVAFGKDDSAKVPAKRIPKIELNPHEKVDIKKMQDILAEHQNFKGRFDKRAPAQTVFTMLDANPRRFFTGTIAQPRTDSNGHAEHKLDNDQHVEDQPGFFSQYRVWLILLVLLFLIAAALIVKFVILRKREENVVAVATWESAYPQNNV